MSRDIWVVTSTRSQRRSSSLGSRVAAIRGLGGALTLTDAQGVTKRFEVPDVVSVGTTRVIVQRSKSIETAAANLIASLAARTANWFFTSPTVEHVNEFERIYSRHVALNNALNEALNNALLDNAGYASIKQQRSVERQRIKNLLRNEDLTKASAGVAFDRRFKAGVIRDINDIASGNVEAYAMRSLLILPSSVPGRDALVGKLRRVVNGFIASANGLMDQSYPRIVEAGKILLDPQRKRSRLKDVMAFQAQLAKFNETRKSMINLADGLMEVAKSFGKGPQLIEIRRKLAASDPERVLLSGLGVLPVVIFGAKVVLVTASVGTILILAQKAILAVQGQNTETEALLRTIVENADKDIQELEQEITQLPPSDPKVQELQQIIEERKQEKKDALDKLGQTKGGLPMGLLVGGGIAAAATGLIFLALGRKKE